MQKTTFFLGLVIAYNATLPVPTLSDNAVEAEIAVQQEQVESVEQPVEQVAQAEPVQNIVPAVVQSEQTKERPRLPVIEPAEPRIIRTYQARAAYYASVPGQTDGNPWVTASGSHVHWGSVAANCLPFGTHIRIPELYGDKVFTVEDRHAPRYGCGLVDVWTDYSPGQNPHNGYVTIEVLERIPER